MSEAARPPSAGGSRSRVDQSNGRAGFEALAEALAAELVEPVARRVVELLRESGQGGSLIDAAEVARRLGRDRSWVYRHAQELAAVRLGGGPRPRLAFDPAKVADYAADSSEGRRTGEPENRSGKPNPTRRRRRRNGQGEDYLPVRGEAPCR